MIKTKKAISPIIASILLIMLVVVIAVIIMVFARNFFNDISTDITGVGGRQIDKLCTEVKLTPIRYNSGEFGFSNDGNVPVDSYRVLTSEGGKETLHDKVETLVGPGAVEKVSGVVIIASYDKVKVIPILSGKNKNGETVMYECPEINALEIL